MIVLSVDPGRTYGIAVLTDGQRTLLEEHKFVDIQVFYDHIYNLANTYRPDVIIYGTPVRYTKVIAFQSKMIGILDLVALQHNISGVPCVDVTCRKELLGNGHATKEDVMKFVGCNKGDNSADAILFAKYFLTYQE